MNWKVSLTYFDNTEDIMYFRTKDEAVRYADFCSTQSRTPGTHIGKRLISSRIERNN